MTRKCFGTGAGFILSFIGINLCLSHCGNNPFPSANKKPLAPRIVTNTVKNDSDDPAIWLHPTDRSQSLILGTDKGDPGELCVFDLNGRIIPEKVVHGLRRPNNVDVEYGLSLNGIATDIAVTTQREINQIRIHRLPDMQALDDGGVEVFSGVPEVLPMGIALYRRSADGAVFMILGRKSGPTDGRYLWQYRLEDDGAGKVKATKVREFGIWSGKGEIEAIAVDDSLGYVYYADEWVGVRKYAADPDVPEADRELALFANKGFKEDREGIAIYEMNGGKGYITVSDQQANTFHFFKREGEPNNPHEHRLVKVLKLSTQGSDGSEVTHVFLNEKFPMGVLIAMSEDRTFHYYSWEDLAGELRK
jgi:3-phytase